MDLSTILRSTIQYGWQFTMWMAQIILVSMVVMSVETWSNHWLHLMIFGTSSVDQRHRVSNEPRGTRARASPGSRANDSRRGMAVISLELELKMEEQSLSRFWAVTHRSSVTKRISYKSRNVFSTKTVCKFLASTGLVTERRNSGGYSLFASF